MAVYTAIDEASLAAFLAAYDLAPLVGLEGIAQGVENSNYVLVTERGSFILTLYEKRVEPKDLPFFLGLMNHLAARGISCPLPVADRNGATLGTLAGRPAAIITFLAGMWPRRIQPFHCAELGTALAQFHRAGATFGQSRRNNPLA